MDLLKYFYGPFSCPTSDDSVMIFLNFSTTLSEGRAQSARNDRLCGEKARNGFFLPQHRWTRIIMDLFGIFIFDQFFWSIFFFKTRYLFGTLAVGVD